LEVRTVELRRTDSKEMGLDWFIGNTEIEAKSAGVFPGGPEASSPRPADSAESPAQVRSAIPPLGQVTGILTEHQFAVVLGALKQRPDTDIKSLPSVTTASGLKTRISWTTASGIPVEVDCVPIVGADGYSVRLMLTMDLGGDADGLDTPDGAAGRASALQESNRQVVVWTGQTMVLGGLISESNSEGTDETSRQLKNVIVFITPSILDTRGNRVPLPDSFAPDTIPRQAMGSDLYY
jgi:type II secretory pathway component GspD/PulD (secretin)